jgi:hypothetical protein
MTEPNGAPSGRRVISFSLRGTAPLYAYGAMINLVLARTVYPGWTCRCYVDAAAPRAAVAFLADNGADVPKIEDEYLSVGLFQRFLVMNNTAVGRFLVRDCDARLRTAEAGLRPPVDRFRLSFPARPRAAQRTDDRLPVGGTHRLRHRYRRIDAALLPRVRQDHRK